MRHAGDRDNLLQERIELHRKAKERRLFGNETDHTEKFLTGNQPVANLDGTLLCNLAA